VNGDIVIRLRQRTGSERMGPIAHPYVLEVGIEGVRDGKPNGKMIAVYLQNEAQIADALRIAADKWEQERKRIIDTGRVMVLQ
jgi:hypothetical protein